MKTETMIRAGLLTIGYAALAAFCLVMWGKIVKAADCPEGAPSCKVLILTPQEEGLLVNQGGILDTAARARYLDLGEVVVHFRDKILKAPAGNVKVPPLPDKAAPKK